LTVPKTNSFIESNGIDTALSSRSGQDFINCFEGCEFPYLSCISLNSAAVDDGVGCDLTDLAEIT